MHLFLITYQQLPCEIYICENKYHSPTKVPGEKEHDSLLVQHLPS